MQVYRVLLALILPKVTVAWSGNGTLTIAPSTESPSLSILGAHANLGGVMQMGHSLLDIKVFLNLLTTECK